MDLSQTKLSYMEWNGIEIPVSKQELNILNLITKGYHNINLVYNELSSLLTILKLDGIEFHCYLYDKFIKEHIDAVIVKYKIDYKHTHTSELVKKKLKKSDEIRIESCKKMIENKNLYLNLFCLIL